MKRALPLVLLLVGCTSGRELAVIQKELSAVVEAENALKLEAGRLTDELNEVKRAADAEGARLARATKGLAALQPIVVRRWDSNPKKLAALKKEHPMPAVLLAALDAAQASGKDATPEKRFEQALTSGELNAAGALISSWEAAQFSYEEPEEQDSCEPEEPKLSKCRGDAKRGVLLCDGTENTWILSAEFGALVTKSAPLTGLTIVERPAPGVWVLAKGNDRNLYEARDSGPLMRFVLALPAEHLGKKATLTWKNLDADPYLEGIYALGPDVRLLDVENAHGVTAVSELESCRRLTALGALPDSAKAGCVAREAAAKASPAPDAGR